MTAMLSHVVLHSCWTQPGELSELGTDRSFGMRNFRYIEDIKEAVERECPGVVSCAEILVLSARDGIVAENHNESLNVVPDRFASIGIDTPGLVALLGAHCVGRIHCMKLVHRLYPEVDPAFPTDHLEHMLKKYPDSIPDPKAVQHVRNDRGTPMKLDNNHYRNILDNKGLLLVDHQLPNDKRTKPHVKKMAKNQDYFKELSRAITILSENNPLTGSKRVIRK
ncbi:hypothetical protein ACH5RR_014833 [Cinchona calisaya]|uniref:peroxidase n=1 Tax=Cinchona calisaya TaxID=153742 RepID=A0ABD2ZRF0_9GENT